MSKSNEENIESLLKQIVSLHLQRVKATAYLQHVKSRTNPEVHTPELEKKVEVFISELTDEIEQYKGYIRLQIIEKGSLSLDWSNIIPQSPIDKIEDLEISTDWTDVETVSLLNKYVENINKLTKKLKGERYGWVQRV